MKKVLLVLIVLITIKVNAQKTITYEEMKTISKGMFENIILKLEEVLSMFKTGKKVHPELKNRFFGILDDINLNFENIKYED